VAVRTLQLDEQIARAVNPGQIVVLGAGLDTRFWRVPVPESARIIEIDSAAVNELARRLLRGGGRGRRVDARIPGGVADALERAEFDPRIPTLWIAEGLLEYLAGPMWERLAQLMTANSAPGSRAIVTVVGENLPSRFAHDPAFPFPRLPSLSAIRSVIANEWRVDVVEARPLRGVPSDAFAIMVMQRA